MCVCLCLCESGNPALQSQYGLLYPVFVYNSAFSLCITPAGRDSQVMERAGEGDRQREREMGEGEKEIVSGGISGICLCALFNLVSGLWSDDVMR